MTPKTREAYNIFPPGPRRTSHVPGLEKKIRFFFSAGQRARLTVVGYGIRKPVRDRFLKFFFSRGGEADTSTYFLTIFVCVCFFRKSPGDVTSVIDAREVTFPRSSVCVCVCVCRRARVYTRGTFGSTSLSKVDWIRHSSACNGIVITYAMPRRYTYNMYVLPVYSVCTYKVR